MYHSREAIHCVAGASTAPALSARSSSDPSELKSAGRCYQRDRGPLSECPLLKRRVLFEPLAFSSG